MSKSSTITEASRGTARSGKRIRRDPDRRPTPLHPGEILSEEFMVPLGMSSNALALALRVPATRISEIVRKRRAITAETAYRLAIYFGTSAEFWVNLQKNYEMALIEHESLPRIQSEVRARVA